MDNGATREIEFIPKTSNKDEAIEESSLKAMGWRQGELVLGGELSPGSKGFK